MAAMQHVSIEIYDASQHTTQHSHMREFGVCNLFGDFYIMWHLLVEGYQSAVIESSLPDSPQGCDMFLRSVSVN